MIKLDAMENPYGLSGASARAEIAAAVANAPINRYPDGGGDAVKAALRRSLALPDDVGADPRQRFGRAPADADDGGRATGRRRAGARSVVRACTGCTRIYADVRFVGVPLRADFTLDIDAMLEAIASEKPALVWLAYPNNPTGNLFSGG